jgi:hypothetical protein
MIKKCILAAALTLSTMAVCNAVQAAPNTTDISRWQDEISFGRAGSSADVKPLRDVEPYGDEDSQICTYLGGPKSSLWTCR